MNTLTVWRIRQIEAPRFAVFADQHGSSGSLRRFRQWSLPEYQRRHNVGPRRRCAHGWSRSGESRRVSQGAFTAISVATQGAGRAGAFHSRFSGEQRAPAVPSAAAHVSGLGNTMTGPRSGSESAQHSDLTASALESGVTCSTASGIREDQRSITVFVLAQAKQSISCCLSIGDKATVTVFGWCLHGSLINSFKIVWHLLFLHQLSRRSISLGFLLCFECFETVALWQHCIDYNTDSARLSVLWKTDASSNKQRKIALIKLSHCSTS